MTDNYNDGAHDEVHEHDEWDEPPRWPKVVGIVTTVLASFSLVCGGIGVLQSAAQVAQHEGGSLALAGLSMQVVGVALAALGIVTGVMTILRKKAGRPLHLVWAGLVLALFIVSLVMMPDVLKQMNEQITKQVAEGKIPPEAEHTARTIGFAFMAFFVALGAVLSGAWPIFCLIWFGPLKKCPAHNAPEVL